MKIGSKLDISRVNNRFLIYIEILKIEVGLRVGEIYKKVSTPSHSKCSFWR
jgi:hypothetical protein